MDQNCEEKNKNDRIKQSDRESSEHAMGTAFCDAVTAAVCSLSSVKFCKIQDEKRERRDVEDEKF